MNSEVIRIHNEVIIFYSSYHAPKKINNLDIEVLEIHKDIMTFKQQNSFEFKENTSSIPYIQLRHVVATNRTCLK